MFEIGWSEILVIAVVAIVVFPSKDLPKLLRTVGQTVGRLRRMAGDFQSQFSQALREAEREIDMEETRQQVQSLKDANPLKDLRSALDPLRTAGEDIRRDIGKLATPMSDPRPPTGVVAEPDGPAKTGPADEPGALAVQPTQAPGAPSTLAPGAQSAPAVPVPPPAAASVPAAPVPPPSSASVPDAPVSQPPAAAPAPQPVPATPAAVATSSSNASEGSAR